MRHPLCLLGWYWKRFAVLVGTLQLSRALTDARLADEVLEEVRDALVLLSAEKPQS